MVFVKKKAITSNKSFWHCHKLFRSQKVRRGANQTGSSCHHSRDWSDMWHTELHKYQSMRKRHSSDCWGCYQLNPALITESIVMEKDPFCLGRQSNFSVPLSARKPMARERYSTSGAVRNQLKCIHTIFYYQNQREKKDLTQSSSTESKWSIMLKKKCNTIQWIYVSLWDIIDYFGVGSVQFYRFKKSRRLALSSQLNVY